MNVEEYRIKLKQREGELLADLERLEAEGRDARIAEVGDPIDDVTSTEGQAAAFSLSTREYEELRQVREALERIEDGTYGYCIVCGREISKERLDAVPWTPYCIEHAKLQDAPAEPELPIV
jgi:DnaK suppressor protein